MFSLFLRWIGSRLSLLLTLALFLGAAPFPYATMLFSHAAVVGMLFIALWALLTEPSSEDSLGRENLAGIACGFVVASEYTAIFTVLGIFALAFFQSFRRGLRVMLFSAAPILLIPAYSFLIYGSPFALSYSHTIHGTISDLFLAPHFSTLFILLFSPARGLFFWTPILLLVLPGYLFLWRRSRTLCLITSIAPLALLFFIAFFKEPLGGFALGPRYLAPSLPLLALPTALGFQRFPRLGIFLGAISLLLTGTATLITAQTPDTFSNPLLELYVPVLREGRGIALNIAKLFGLEGNWSFLPLLLLLLIGGYFLWCSLPRERATGGLSLLPP